jgi:cytoskeleton protein RodZ
MVMQPSYDNGVIESPTIEISQEGLRSILNQIEAELLNSEAYRRTMAGLQTMVGEGFGTAQILVKAVGREAVRLTFQQFTKRYKVVPVASEGMNHAKHEESNSPQMVRDNPIQADSQANPTAATQVTQSVKTNTPRPLFGKHTGKTKPTKKLTKAQLAAQIAQQEREELLRQVGRELRQAREERSLSVLQLHRQTLVPTHQIEALEAGRLDDLPEDVYIRGFIRRIGHALGLNGVMMADSIPKPDPVKSVVPSWYESVCVPGFQVNSIHLYIGYTALIAGAVGGISWMSSNQSTAKVSAEPKPAPSSHTTVSPKAEGKEATKKPGVKLSKTGVKVKAGADIAPPETLPLGLTH